MKFHGILMTMLLLAMLIVSGAAADSQVPLNTAGSLFSESVELAT